MISDYMEDIDYANPFSHLKPSQKTPYEKAHGKYITKTADGKYVLHTPYLSSVQNECRRKSLLFL